MKRLIILCVLFFGAVTDCRADAILSISPASQTATLGSRLSFDIYISGLGGGNSLGSYDITLGFDPTIISFDNATFGNQVDISGLGDIQFVSSGTNSVELFELSLDSAAELIAFQASAFSLATLSFDTLAPATNSLVTFSVDTLGDAYGNSINAEIHNGSVSVVVSTSPVPEPSSLLLVLGAVPAYVLWQMSSWRIR